MSLNLRNDGHETDGLVDGKVVATLRGLHHGGEVLYGDLDSCATINVVQHGGGALQNVLESIDASDVFRYRSGMQASCGGDLTVSKPDPDEFEGVDRGAGELAHASELIADFATGDEIDLSALLDALEVQDTTADFPQGDLIDTSLLVDALVAPAFALPLEQLVPCDVFTDYPQGEAIDISVLLGPLGGQADVGDPVFADYSPAVPLPVANLPLYDWDGQGESGLLHIVVL